MSTLTDRLRDVMRTGAPPRAARPDTPTLDRRAHVDAAADVLGGAWCESGGQRFLVVDRTYVPGHRHGRIAIADVLPPAGGPWPRLSLLGSPECGGRMLFLDLETTGLAGGAGTYAFLVGLAWFDGGVLRVRQYFLSSFAAERALLDAVAGVATTPGTVVTYNGKTFDIPLLDTRFILHRMPTPFAGAPHVDMLHPARRLWRGEDDAAARSSSSCRLSLLEQTLLGHVREGDVPGFEIPLRYFHFVRTGDARGLEAVLEHNRLDLISLALVTARAAQMLDEGPGSATTGREALGLGRLYERGGMTEEARACYARAAGLEHACGAAGVSRVDWLTRAEALRAFALMARRDRRFDEAATAWEAVVTLRRCPPSILQQAIEALAVHHEHRRRDPHAARTLALRSLSYPASATRTQAVRHRLARLNRKLGDAKPMAALF